MLDDRFEARGFQAFFGGLCRLSDQVWANLHAVIFITLRRLHEGDKFFLAKIVGQRDDCVGFSLRRAATCSRMRASVGIRRR